MRAVAVLATVTLLAAIGPQASAATPFLRYVAVGGDRLAYVERGHGEPIILVHGGLQDYRMWSPVAQILSRHYRVIAYSRRNHFPNAIDRAGWPDTAADLHAQDLAALIIALKLGTVNVIAHSSGAHAALFLVADHPELVRYLVVNEPPASGLLADSPANMEIARSFGRSLEPSREAFRRGDLTSGATLFSDAVNGPGAFESRTVAEQKMLLENAVAHEADAVSTRPRPAYSCAMARRITVPVLITNGGHSPPFFHVITDILSRCILHAKGASFPSSHGLPREQPKLFADEVLKFLKKTDR